MISNDADAKGVALVGMALSFGLISRLSSKGLLTDDDVAGIFEGALSTLEDQAPDSPEVRVARVLLDGMAAISARVPRP